MSKKDTENQNEERMISKKRETTKTGMACEKENAITANVRLILGRVINEKFLLTKNRGGGGGSSKANFLLKSGRGGPGKFDFLIERCTLIPEYALPPLVVWGCNPKNRKG